VCRRKLGVGSLSGDRGGGGRRGLGKGGKSVQGIFKQENAAGSEEKGGGRRRVRWPSLSGKGQPKEVGYLSTRRGGGITSSVGREFDVCNDFWNVARGPIDGRSGPEESLHYDSPSGGTLFVMSLGGQIQGERCGRGGIST